MNMKGMKEDVHSAMDEAFASESRSAATAFYLEALAKMKYFEIFNEVYEYDGSAYRLVEGFDKNKGQEDEDTESTSI